MKIDKSKLKMGLWYEDRDGNIIPHDLDNLDIPKEAWLYATRWPLEITEKVYGIYKNKDTCKHPLKHIKVKRGWAKGIKFCECKKCGKNKEGKWYVPFAFMPWNYGSDTYEMFSFTNHIGRGNEDVIMAMVNSGDYTLSEALIVWASACERCMNVIAYKYLNGKDGYEEHSEEWEKSNTQCEFCK